MTEIEQNTIRLSGITARPTRRRGPSSFRPDLREVRRVPREFGFYELYPAMSRDLIENYVSDYDWISWPDQDEFLEGPARDRSYHQYVLEAHDLGIDWI